MNSLNGMIVKIIQALMFVQMIIVNAIRESPDQQLRLLRRQLKRPGVKYLHMMVLFVMPASQNVVVVLLSSSKKSGNQLTTPICKSC